MAGAANDILRCEIDHVDIEDDLTYEAVSYVWGTTENMPCIQISCVHGDSELEIPANLRGALRRFRHPSLMRTLWVDSICINQKDDNEHSQQVRLMGQIYRKASTVLIWLGGNDDDGKTEKAYNCMNLLKQAYPKLKDVRIDNFKGLPNTTQQNSFLGITRESPDDVHRDLGIPLRGSPEFFALIDLLKASWFSRAWTWQESFLAKERKFFHGSWSWSGRFMMEVCLVLCGLNSVSGNDNDLPDVYRDVLPMIAGFEFWTRRKESNKSYLELSALLTLRRGSGCTYPGDLLYSLLGAARGSFNIEVDYSQPFEVVFAKSTWQIMVQRGKLSMFSKVEKDRQASTLPT